MSPSFPYCCSMLMSTVVLIPPWMCFGQVIGYNVSADGKWCLAIGIFQASPGVIAGTMQLYRCACSRTVCCSPCHSYGIKHPPELLLRLQPHAKYVHHAAGERWVFLVYSTGQCGEVVGEGGYSFLQTNAAGLGGGRGGAGCRRIPCSVKVAFCPGSSRRGTSMS